MVVVEEETEQEVSRRIRRWIYNDEMCWTISQSHEEEDDSIISIRMGTDSTKQQEQQQLLKEPLLLHSSSTLSIV